MSTSEVKQSSEEPKESTPISPSSDTAISDGVSVDFDIDIVIQGFQECVKEDGLYIDGYIRAYTEITKFFEVLGTVFSFVTSDLHSKLNTLRCYRKGGSADYYYSIQSMLEYEKNQPSLTQPSASRTLLRLHRALAFISGFMREMRDLDLDTKLGPAAQATYSRTLAKHHAWLISKTVSAVILLLPTKKTIMDRLVGDGVTQHRKLETKSLELCDLMDKVYGATQSFYSDYDMLNLP